MTLNITFLEENLDKIAKVTTNLENAGDIEVDGTITAGKIEASTLIGANGDAYTIKVKAFAELGSLVGDAKEITVKWENGALVVVD